MSGTCHKHLGGFLASFVSLMTKCNSKFEITKTCLLLYAELYISSFYFFYEVLRNYLLEHNINYSSDGLTFT